MKPKHIRVLFFMSFAELVCLLGCILFAYTQSGNAPLIIGLAGLILMVCSFTGSIYGMFEMKVFKENHDHMGMIGTRLHILIFLLLIFLYAAGIAL